MRAPKRRSALATLATTASLVAACTNTGPARSDAHPALLPSIDAADSRDASTLERADGEDAALHCMRLAIAEQRALDRATLATCSRDDECSCAQIGHQCAPPTYVATASFNGQITAVRALHASRLAAACRDAALEDANNNIGLCAPPPPCEPACVAGRCQRSPACATLHEQVRRALDANRCRRDSDCAAVDGLLSRRAIQRRALRALRALRGSMQDAGCSLPSELALSSRAGAECVRGQCRPTSAPDDDAFGGL